MIKVTLKGGNVKEFEKGTSIMEVALSISERFAQNAAAGEIGGKMYDLRTKLENDLALNILSIEDEAARSVLRHTASHVMAQAVSRLYPETKLAIGPSIDTGFYYDFDRDMPFSTEDLTKIEKEMEKIVKEDLPIERFTLPRQDALKLMSGMKQPYKLELIEDLDEAEEISFYKQGDFTDLCAGPHLMSTGKIKAFKLMSVAGAYWRGSEKNKMLQRIYGTAFAKNKELTEYITLIEEAKKRDHRKLGKELDLYTIDEEVGQGLVLWHPKLSIVREIIEIYWRKEHRKRGYEYIYTPHIGQSNLWETSGHLGHYADTMYPAMKMEMKDADEKTSYYVKPMSCPFHIRIYKTRPHSYRELPIRWCELGSVYRFEKSGTLHGMLRVRGFTQDDAHIFCTQEQFVEEVNNVLDFALDMNRDFGYDKLKVYLSVRDSADNEKYIKNEEMWLLAETTLEKILVDRNMEYQKDVGGAKFYGPAIDLKAVDAMGREWQGTTIQLDMNLPQLFDMKYVGADGKEHTPIMLHRTLLGAMERFVGTLIEHYAGAFPLWLSPVQVKILPVSDKNMNYAAEIDKILKNMDIRSEIDDRNEKIGYKIREAQLEKTPYMLILGDKETESKNVSVRSRKDGDLGVMEQKVFFDRLVDEVNRKV